MLVRALSGIRGMRFSFQEPHCSEGKSTGNTKIIAHCRDQNYSGSGKCSPELISEKLLILLRERPRLELIIVSSNFKALFFFRDKLLESV